MQLKKQEPLVEPEKMINNLDWRILPCNGSVRIQGNYMGAWQPGYFHGVGDNGYLYVKMDGDDHVREARRDNIRLVRDQTIVNGIPAQQKGAAPDVRLAMHAKEEAEAVQRAQDAEAARVKAKEELRLAEQEARARKRREANERRKNGGYTDAELAAQNAPPEPVAELPAEQPAEQPGPTVEEAFAEEAKSDEPPTYKRYVPPAHPVQFSPDGANEEALKALDSGAPVFVKNTDGELYDATFYEIDSGNAIVQIDGCDVRERIPYNSVVLV